MSQQDPAHIDAIFQQMRQLRRSMDALRARETDRVESLRGHQTVDDEGAVALSFDKIADDIASIEQTLLAIAEATGELPRLEG